MFWGLFFSFFFYGICNYNFLYVLRSILLLLLPGKCLTLRTTFIWVTWARISPFSNSFQSLFFCTSLVRFMNVAFIRYSYHYLYCVLTQNTVRLSSHLTISSNCLTSFFCWGAPKCASYCKCVELCYTGKDLYLLFNDVK